jgi:uncharacterized protein (TIGR00255 family)
MTGFGDASAQEDGVHYSAELRSLNNRYFKATIRLPEEIAGLEAELESALRKRVNRGSLVLAVKMYMPDAQAAHQVNDGALMAYLDHLEAIHRKVRAEGDRAVNIDLTALLGLPGVLLPTRDAENALAKARPVVMKLVDQACDKLDAMRQTEGAATAADLKHHATAIGERLAEIRKRAPAVVEEYHTRLRGRIDDLMARAELKVNEVDLVREVAIYADRADINEEVARLAAHLEQFGSIVNATDGEPAGRTLEFMCQEMLREANTIGSKSNDAQISRAIVEVKSAIDRIKEQSHNVE